MCKVWEGEGAKSARKQYHLNAWANENPYSEYLLSYLSQEAENVFC